MTSEDCFKKLCGLADGSERISVSSGWARNSDAIGGDVSFSYTVYAQRFSSTSQEGFAEALAKWKKEAVERRDSEITRLRRQLDELGG